MKNKEKKFELFIKQNENLPDYFVNLILWKLKHDKPTDFWIEKMTERINFIQKYL